MKSLYGSYAAASDERPEVHGVYGPSDHEADQGVLYESVQFKCPM